MRDVIIALVGVVGWIAGCGLVVAMLQMVGINITGTKPEEE